LRNILILSLSILGLSGSAAIAQTRMKGKEARQQFSSAPPEQKRTVRLNRGLFDLVGQQPDLGRTCGCPGAQTVNTKRNGGDALVSFLTIGLYTPAHSYIVCNPAAAGT
jgi:hypothetical protein